MALVERLLTLPNTVMNCCPDGWPEFRPSVTPNWAPNPSSSTGSDGIATFVPRRGPELRSVIPAVGVTSGSPGCFKPSKEKLKPVR
jgi:hypothetical protein